MKSLRLVFLILLIGIVQGQAEPPLVSRIYRVPKSMFEGVPGAKLEPATFDAAGVPVRAYDVRPWLEGQGLAFSKGHKAFYITELESVVLLTSQDNIDIADSFMIGCFGLPHWSLKSQLTLVSFTKQEDPSSTNSAYEELKRRAGDSWKVISTLEISSKLDGVAVGSVIQNGSMPPIAKGKKPADTLPPGVEGVYGSSALVVYRTGVELEATISYRFRGKDDQSRIQEFNYDGSIVGTVDQPQVLQVFRGDPSYALILKVEWMVPTGDSLSTAGAESAKTN